jgi:hypothetical protein
MTKISNQYSLTNVLTADTTNGRVGINNGSPSVALDVTGAGKFSTTVTAQTGFKLPANGNGTSPTLAYNNSLGFGVSGTGIFFGNLYNSDLSTAMQLRVTNSGGTDITAMTITPDGNVGIGISSPFNVVANRTSVSINGTSTSILSFGSGGVGKSYIYNDGTNLETSSSGALIYTIAGSERMRITSGGSMLMAKNSVIGINTDDGADDGYLALSGASADGPTRGGYIYLSGNERASDPGHVTIGAGNVIGIGSVITFRTAGTERMRLIGNGRLLIGTSTDQGYLLFVNGNAAGTSGFANVSDGRLKKDIVPIENALNKVNKLNGVSFNWDKDSRTDLTLDDNNHLGLIAQDVEKILPQVVSTGDDELQTKTITYSDIVPVLIEAIKELSKEIEILKQK